MEKLINDFSFGLFFWQLLLFVLLLFLLKKYAWQPILDALNSREEGIQNALDEADKARQEMVDLKSSNEKIIKEARAERDSMLKDARAIKEKMITEAKDEAKAQSNKIIEQAKQTIENEKLAAITELKNQVAELSIGIAEKILKDELSSKDKQVKLIEKMLDEAKLK
ncbi:F0F1 ATP synthase subunit B [Lutimonas zeaxanthinifaciens]|uniref:F0F1 ATP synthase subunit B n=1 Tax=Lutimonas zeaxanthinifaciens TaxID=3060215 RepID=UPI00265CB489|nr:F0F1 ATP synthase subunit B [Lutimonas sp. YSD2104]WKK66570.1 F0F1 ATP synthase subunit B [Lutimonas sp. YSD2104]